MNISIKIFIFGLIIADVFWSVSLMTISLLPDTRNVFSTLNNNNYSNTSVNLVPAVDLFYHHVSVSNQKQDQLLLKSYLPKRIKQRTKRFLIFNGNGIIKLVIGYSQPLDFGTKNPYQQLSMLYNFQMQYQPPTSTSYLLNPTFWQTNDEFISINRKQNFKRSLDYDNSRKFIYEIVESFLSHKGFDGKNCLLKLICDVAKNPIYGDTVVHKILRAVLSPIVHNIDADYLDARKAGLQGAYCESCYQSCTENNLLENISYYV